MRPTRRRRAVTIVAATLVIGLTATGCGADEAAMTGDPVEGRAPTMPDQPSTTDTPGDPATTATSEAATTTAGADAPGPLGAVDVDLAPIATLEAPVKLVTRPGSDLLYVAQQVGTVVTIDPEAGEDATPTEVLDLTAMTRSGGEQGLLGLAFSPDGATLYVHHSGTSGETHVASYAMTDEAADPGTRVQLLTVAQPYANHNGGDILVDDDGLLWIGLGDGGSADDPEQRAQDPDELLGKILRIDPRAPSADTPYSIPEGNMFAEGEGRPEIVVVGVRNPWRMRFDAATGDLWVADVGQDRLEEIDRLPAGSIIGSNLGWSRWEGSEEYQPSHPLGSGTLVGPVFEMEHEDGWCSVSGGVVYRGADVPDLDGAYLFGDFCKAGLSAIRVLGEGDVETTVLDDAIGSVVSIDAGADGEVYVLSLDGTVYRVTAA